MLEKKISLNEKKYILILWVLAILVSIKTIFTDYNTDSAYSTVMSFRHICGDSMLFTMWEPHQTSIFLTDILMLIYKIFVPSLSGVVIYLEICGTLLFLLICYPIYNILKPITGKYAAQVACIFFLIFRAKQTVYPEFSNMQIAFSTLLFAFLLLYFNNTKRTYYLVLSALSLCLTVLSYPSCAIIFFVVVCILLFYSENKCKDILIFAGVCFLSGMVYLLYFVFKLGTENLISVFGHIINSDTHKSVSSSGYEYWKGFLIAILWVAVSLLLAFIFNKIIKKAFYALFAIFLCVIEVVMIFITSGKTVDWTCTFYIIPILLMVIAYTKYSTYSKQIRRVLNIGTGISFGCFFATLVFTDLGIITIFSYMVLGGVVSIAILGKDDLDKKCFITIIMCLVLIHRGLVVWGMGQNSGVWKVWQIENIYRKGPNAGIVADYMSCYEALCDYEDYSNFTSEEDTLFVIEHWLLDPTVFMYSDASISNLSVINTPLYGDETFKYFEEHPDKYPTVIAVDCWYGNLNVSEDTEIMKWVNNNYHSYTDGRYWRFYRK